MRHVFFFILCLVCAPRIRTAHYAMHTVSYHGAVLHDSRLCCIPPTNARILHHFRCAFSRHKPPLLPKIPPPSHVFPLETHTITFYIVKYVTFPYGDFQGCCGLYFVQYAIFQPVTGDVRFCLCQGMKKLKNGTPCPFAERKLVSERQNVPRIELEHIRSQGGKSFFSTFFGRHHPPPPPTPSAHHHVLYSKICHFSLW